MRTNQQAYELAAQWFDEGVERVRFLLTLSPPGDVVVAMTRVFQRSMVDGSLGPDKCAAMLAVALVRLCERTSGRGPDGVLRR